MNPSIEKQFFERFKFFHPEKPVQESLMVFGFECGDGWKDLLWKLCEDIEEELKENPLESFEVIQVKEKFGGLRFYTNNGTDKIYSLIDEAEQKSETICENCGEPGSVENINDWFSCSCKKCFSKRK